MKKKSRRVVLDCYHKKKLESFKKECCGKPNHHESKCYYKCFEKIKRICSFCDKHGHHE